MKYFNKEIFPIIKALFNIKLIIPNLIIKNIIELDIDFLIQQGIKGIIFDLDQTLTRYGSDSIYKPYRQQFSLIMNTFKCVILSNPPKTSNYKPTKIRFNTIAQQYKIKIIKSPNKKPNPIGYKLAINVLNLNPNQVAMIGDRILTDILGANLCNIYSILVDPIAGDIDPSNLISIPRRLERCLLTLVSGGAKHG